MTNWTIWHISNMSVNSSDILCLQSYNIFDLIPLKYKLIVFIFKK
jgi:hypothetical protein